MSIKKPSKSLVKHTTAKSETKTRWLGSLDGIYNGRLFGWAVDTQHPDARVVLEVCSDDVVVGCLIADVVRTDLAETFGNIFGSSMEIDYCHGFVADLGASIENHKSILTVRIANTDTILPGHIDNTKQRNDKRSPLTVASKVFGDGGLRLHGWLIDSQNDTRSLVVRAFCRHQLIAETVADLIHPALRSADVGSHGFNLNLPLDLADGNQHEIRIVDENGSPLNGSPVTVCCFANGTKTLISEQDNELLSKTIDFYERFLPRSVGMEYYPQWSALFELEPQAEIKNKASLSSKGNNSHLGIIITGEADEMLFNRTIASLKSQIGVVVHIFSEYEKAPNATKKSKTSDSTLMATQNSFATLLDKVIDSPCEFFACVRAGDTLRAHALSTALEGFEIAQSQLVYTDSEFDQPWFKPAWDIEYAYATDYPLELMVGRCDLLRSVFAQISLPESAASLSWKLIASLCANQNQQKIVHVPRVLYQFHTALSSKEKKVRMEAAQRALASAEPTSSLVEMEKISTSCLFHPRRLQRNLTAKDKRIKVSLIIPTRDYVDLLERCVSSIQKYTKWKNLEIIIVDNGSVQAETKTYFKSVTKKGVKVLSLPGPFNFSALNNQAVAVASGEIIGMINNDIEALNEGWLDEMVSHLLQPGVGAVGAKLIWPNGMVQHGGVVLGIGNVAGHFGNRLADADFGDHGRNQLVQKMSAVTAACLMVRKSDFLAVGGMDPIAFPVAFNDLDLCLKLRQAGKDIIWTPFAKLLHAESASRGHEDTPQKIARAQREVDNLRRRWGAILLNDPTYHPSLNLDAHSQVFNGLALPPRNRRPRLASLIDHTSSISLPSVANIEHEPTRKARAR